MVEPVTTRYEAEAASPSPLHSRRFRRVVMALLAVLVVGWVIWSVRSALVPFAVGAVVAYLLAPIVTALERTLPLYSRWPALSRSLAILISYVVVAGLLAIAGMLLVPPLARQTTEFVRSVPQYFAAANEQLFDWLDRYQAEVPPQIRNQIETNLTALGSVAVSALRMAVAKTFDAVGAAIGFFSAVVLLPFWLFYVLKDERRALAWFYGLWPQAWRDDVRVIVRIIDRTLAAYIRGQLFLGLVIGVATGFAMTIIGMTQPIVLGVIAGVLELVPILGPILTFIVIALVALATEPSKLVWVGLAFIVIQQLENNLLVPRIHGHLVQMNPAVVMLLVVIGGALWGIPGMIVIVPLAAICRDVFRYLYHRLGDEPSS
jgi:predicted PurR-regulated permease PerM